MRRVLVLPPPALLGFPRLSRGTDEQQHRSSEALEGALDFIVLEKSEVLMRYSPRMGGESFSSQSGGTVDVLWGPDDLMER